ncbi:MAG TPA: glycosyltransferase family 39 protein [Anaerolineales bacterium]|nr:glycosyltransferase family 39 protein [Anaerolineales bacterium]
MKHKLFLLALLIVAGIGVWAIWYSSPYGFGLVNDSATYVEGATNLLAGNGYVRTSGGGELKPITHFPPLFSLLLAALGMAGFDLLEGGRLAISLLFGIDIVLVGLSVYKISGSQLFALLGALLLAASDVHLGVYAMLMSEPLFLTLLLATCLALAKSFEHQHWGWPLLTGILLSLTILTRYAGASLLIPILLTFTLLKMEGRPPIPGRISLRANPLWAVALLLAGMLLPLLAWMGYNLRLSQASSLGNRQFNWHPIPLATLLEGIKNLLTWLAPDDLLAAHRLWGWLFSLLALIVVPGILAWLGWVIWHQWRGRPAVQPSTGSLALAFVLAAHILTYLGFLILSISLFDATTPLNDRILAVAYVPEMILFASGLAWLWQALGKQEAAKWILALFCAGLVLASLWDGATAVHDLRLEGRGFAHQGWQESPAIQTVRDLPTTTIIYSDKPGAIFLLTGRAAYVLPTPMDAVTTQARANFAGDLAQMQTRLLGGQAVLVLFDLQNSAEPADVATYDEISAGMPVLANYGNVIIFGSLP